MISDSNPTPGLVMEDKNQSLEVAAYHQSRYWGLSCINLLGFPRTPTNIVDRTGFTYTPLLYTLSSQFQQYNITCSNSQGWIL